MTALAGKVFLSRNNRVSKPEEEENLRIAVLSDIHANLEALQAVDKQLNAERVLVLGDSIGYGANPNEVLDWLRGHNCICVKGNHEEAVITGDISWFNPAAARAILWTRSSLSPENVDYLASLKGKRLVEFDRVTISMMHGSPNDPLYEYVYEETHSHLFDYYLGKENVSMIAIGHTHVPMLWIGKRGIVLNPGSVGQPRDGDNRASFAVVTIENGVPVVEHHRVKYDIRRAADKILSAGLPQMLAKRLYYGR